VLVSTQAPGQGVSVPQPVQVRAMHASLDAQAWLQVPQFAGSVLKSTQ
jgi:hypothetical protein